MPKSSEQTVQPTKRSRGRKPFSGLLNLTEASETFIERLKEDGFNGVYFSDCYTENITDPKESDGEPQEILDECNKHYAIFVIQPEFDDLMDDYDDSPYTSPREVDTDSFWEDMKKEMRKVFGSDVTIKCVGYGGCEWEIIRENQYKHARRKFDKWWKSQKGV